MCRVIEQSIRFSLGKSDRHIIFITLQQESVESDTRFFNLGNQERTSLILDLSEVIRESRRFSFYFRFSRYPFKSRNLRMVIFSASSLSVILTLSLYCAIERKYANDRALELEITGANLFTRTNIIQVHQVWRSRLGK